MFFPQYTVNATVIAGNEKGSVGLDGARFLDNLRIEGTLDTMLEETIKFLLKSMKMKTIIDQHSSKRIDKTEYPVVALREAVLNTLLYRDYSKYTQGMPVEVIMYHVPE